MKTISKIASIVWLSLFAVIILSFCVYTYRQIKFDYIVRNDYDMAISSCFLSQRSTYLENFIDKVDEMDLYGKNTIDGSRNMIYYGNEQYIFEYNFSPFVCLANNLQLNKCNTESSYHLLVVTELQNLEYQYKVIRDIYSNHYLINKKSIAIAGIVFILLSIFFCIMKAVQNIMYERKHRY